MIMFTVSNYNKDDLIPVINLVAKEKVTVFDFARLVPIGNATQLRELLLTPKEYRTLLIQVLKEYLKLKEKGCSTFFWRKDNLWKLLYQELGLLPSNGKQKKIIVTGCNVGISSLTILADGTIYPCRRLPIKIGKVTEQSMREIFINSRELNELREVEKMEKCGKCDLLPYCRGCPAVAYAVNGSYFSLDPQCWKEIKLNERG